MKWVSKFIARYAIIIFTSLLIIFSAMYHYTFYYRNAILSPQIFSHFVESVLLDPMPLDHSQAPGHIAKKTIEIANDERYIGGLLATTFENTSCLSRYQSSKYRKPSPFKPSTYLLNKLRNYEKLHRRCGPGTQPYNETLRLLELNHTTNSQKAQCNYVVYICLQYNCGLGNRILATSAVFLYALITDRVLLIDHGNLTQMMNMQDLFCEPFPSSSWFLPQNFPLSEEFQYFISNHPNCHGNMLKNNLLSNSTIINQQLPSYLYLHLSHEANHHDKLFFCDEEQTLLKNVPWLILRSNLYFVPSLFLIPSFKQELSRLFPNKETTFHHLGRYLFHPSNQVWKMITSYYDTYLTNVDERVGIQMRLFINDLDMALELNQRLLSCISNESLLPEINKYSNSNYTSSNFMRSPKSITVLITSLDPRYYENLKNLYKEFQNVSREVMISFYQPSHDEVQQTFDHQMHERRALAEMYLLSLSDKLVTSGRSTFGYVAQGLGGLKPWSIYQPYEMVTKDPSSPCRRVMSIEPCFHDPPKWDCKAKKVIDIGKFVSYIRECEDISWGVKLVDDG